MQSPSIPEAPGTSPVIPEETPSAPEPEVPGTDPARERPQERPAHPDDPDDGGVPQPPAPEALDVRIP
jgi:hypothetical protein